MLVIAPARTAGVDRGPGGKIINKDVRERHVVRTVGPPVASQRENSGRAAAPAAIVPESRPQPGRQARVRHGVPAPLGQGRPGRVAGDLREPAERLGIPGRAVAPAVAVTLDQFRLELGIGVRDEEALWPGLVPRDDVGRAGQGQGHQVGPAGRLTGGSERADDAEGAVRDVVEPGGVAGPHFPVHPARGRLGPGQVRGDREDGQVDVARRERGERDAGVAAEQLELIGPPLPVEPRPDQAEGPGRGRARGRVTQQVTRRVQRERHPGQAEIQRRQRPFPVYRGDDRADAALGGLRVGRVPEVTVALQEGEHDPGRSAVQGRIEFVVPWPARPRQCGAVLAGHHQQPGQCVPG